MLCDSCGKQRGRLHTVDNESLCDECNDERIELEGSRLADEMFESEMDWQRRAIEDEIEERHYR